jgi:hypothetical protein
MFKIVKLPVSEVYSHAMCVQHAVFEHKIANFSINYQLYRFLGTLFLKSAIKLLGFVIDVYTVSNSPLFGNDNKKIFLIIYLLIQDILYFYCLVTFYYVKGFLFELFFVIL